MNFWEGISFVLSEVMLFENFPPHRIGPNVKENENNHNERPRIIDDLLDHLPLEMWWIWVHFHEILCKSA